MKMRVQSACRLPASRLVRAHFRAPPRSRRSGSSLRLRDRSTPHCSPSNCSFTFVHLRPAQKVVAHCLSRSVCLCRCSKLHSAFSDAMCLLAEPGIDAACRRRRALGSWIGLLVRHQLLSALLTFCACLARPFTSAVMSVARWKHASRQFLGPNSLLAPRDPARHSDAFSEHLTSIAVEVLASGEAVHARSLFINVGSNRLDKTSLGDRAANPTSFS